MENQHVNYLAQKGESWFSSATFKFIIISFIVLILLIPASMVENLIMERQMQSNSAFQQIESQWASPQKIAACVLNIPVETRYTENKEEKIRMDNLVVLPDLLNITGKIVPEIRYRGIYKFPVYTVALRITGKLMMPKSLPKFTETYKLNEAVVTLGISDLRGIENTPVLKMAGKAYEAVPGVPGESLTKSGVTFKVPIADSTQLGDFVIDLNLKGSDSILFYPLGKETSIDLQSPWTSPSFTGNFLPKDRKVDEKGFTAQWKVLYLNRNYPQEWINQAGNIEGSEVGVSLLQTVDHYQKAMRSVKYSLLFTALTFMAFFLAEVIRKRKIHPIQYSFTGFALIIFYSLMTALSEHLSFNMAFVLSTVLIIGLITSYSHSSFKDKKFTAIIAVLLCVLYLFLFTLLQLENYALLLGNIGLFAALATIMFVSRKINWYKPMVNSTAQEENPLEKDIE
jgi:inner membrane protein